MSGVLITKGAKDRGDVIIALFSDTFAASEGADEGALIGELARNLLSGTSDEDIRVFCAEDDAEILGAGIFTRLMFPEDDHIVFLLSPMAVATSRQGQGLGQRLLRHALKALAAEGVQVAITYGDPDFYGRVGFKPITEAQVRPPLQLTYPHGWIGQSLTGGDMPTLKGPSLCVPALNRQDVW